MPLHPDFREMLCALFDEDVEFLLVGAMAVAAHGYGRATGDMDILVRPSPDNARRVMQSLRKFGAPLHGLTVRDLSTPGRVFQMGVPPWRIDILTSIEGVTFEDAWPNRFLKNTDGLEMPVISRADLIRNKKTVARLQDLADVARLEGKSDRRVRKPSPRRRRRP